MQPPVTAHLTPAHLTTAHLTPAHPVVSFTAAGLREAAEEEKAERYAEAAERLASLTGQPAEPLPGKVVDRLRRVASELEVPPADTVFGHILAAPTLRHRLRVASQARSYAHRLAASGAHNETAGPESAHTPPRNNPRRQAKHPEDNLGGDVSEEDNEFADAAESPDAPIRVETIDGTIVRQAMHHLRDVFMRWWRSHPLRAMAAYIHKSVRIPIDDLLRRPDGSVADIAPTLECEEFLESLASQGTRSVSIQAILEELFDHDNVATHDVAHGVTRDTRRPGAAEVERECERYVDFHCAVVSESVLSDIHSVMGIDGASRPDSNIVLWSDVRRNALHSEFQTLVQLRFQLNQKRSGSRVTYANDERRVVCTYNTNLSYIARCAEFGQHDVTKQVIIKSSRGGGIYKPAPRLEQKMFDRYYATVG